MSEIQDDVLPSSWVSHVDEWAGYSLAHPPGWQVLCNGGPVIAREDTAGLVEASIWPVRAPPGAASVQMLAQKYVEWVRHSNPSFEAWPVEETEPAPGRALLRTRSRLGPQVLEGRTNITLVGSDVMIRSFHAPAEASADPTAAPPRAADMIRILDSFRAIPPVARQPFHEPQHSAFAVLVPAGWTASGKVETSWTGGVNPVFSCQRDQRRLTKYCVPAQAWMMMDGLFNPRFMPATKFSATLLAKKLKSRSLRVEAAEEWPPLLPHFYATAALASQKPQDLEITTARATCTADIAGTPVRQHIFIATSRPRGGMWSMNLGAGMWFANLLAYYHAPQAEFAAIEPVLAGIAGSWRINPNWLQQQVAEQQMVSQMLAQQAAMQTMQVQQNFMNAQRHIWENQRQVGNMISQSWQFKNAVQDRAMHNWSNATLGRTDVLNPATGTAYSVQNDFDQYWRTNDGYIIGGSWGTQPDPSWQRLEPFKM